MFEDLPKPKSHDFPRKLEFMSIEELRVYIADLQAEITRVEQDISKKQSSLDAASALFKS